MGIRSNLVDSFGSGVIVTGPGWLYLAPTYYAEQLYSRAAGSYPLQVERDSALPWQLQQPDVSATLSADGRLLRIYAVNSTPRQMTPAFAFLDSAAHAAGATAFVVKNRDGKPDTEALNSAGDRLAVSIDSRTLPIGGSRFPVSLEPYSLTLVEVRLSE